MSVDIPINNIILGNLKQQVNDLKWDDASNTATSLFSLWRKKSLSLTPEELQSLFTLWTETLKNTEEPFDPLRPALSTFVNVPPTPKMPKIILNIMIKNEQVLLGRCFKAAMSIVDAVAVADTGSTDQSLTIIRDAVPTDIPLSIEVNAWKNFGHNRTLGVHQAQRLAKRLGWSLDHTFILLLDADMILEIHKFEKNSLCLDQYDLEQRSGSEQYYNPRLLKASIPWNVLGATHEYYNSPVPHSSAQLHTLSIDDRNDGANRSDKFSRDEKLLLGDLLENPSNGRAMFYLAQTYQHRNDKTKNDSQHAITYYEKHIAAKTWEEETWYSFYSIGICYEQLNLWAYAVDAYLKAFLRRPSRIEPIYKIAKYYRDRDEHHLAMIFFQKCLQVPYPKQDILFVEGQLYKYEVPWHTSISAYYTGQKEIGHYALERAVRAKNVPYYIRNGSYYNARFYMKPVPGLLKTTNIRPKCLPPNYLPCNPSLLVQDNNLWVNCRCVSYSQLNARNYRALEPDGIFRTKNILQIYKENPPLLSHENTSPLLSHEHLILNQQFGPFVHSCQVRGAEDVRIFWWKKNMYATCTSLEHTPDNRPKLCLMEFDEKCDEVVKVIRLHGHDDHAVQKNWLPFVQNDELYFIYGYNPKLTILKYIGEGRVQVHLEKDIFSEIETSGYRGSSGPVKLPQEQGWLLSIHECHDVNEGRRYMHRFVWLDHDFSLKYLSNLFYFIYDKGVEINLSMALSTDEKRLYCAIGKEDSEAFVCEYDLEHVLDFTTQKCKAEFLN